MADSRRERSSRFKSLTIKLAVGFFTLSALVLVIGGVMNVVLTFRAQRRLMADRQQLVAQNAAHAVRDYIQDKISVMGTAIAFAGMAHESLDKQKLVLDKMIGREASFRQMILVSRQGRDLARVSRMSQSFSRQMMKDNKYVVPGEGISGRSISSVYVDAITNEPMMLVSLPVKDVFGDYSETLIAEINLKYMWDVIDSLRVGKGGIAYVIDSHGNLIAFRDISRILKGENLTRLDVVQKWKKETSPLARQVYVGRGIMGTRVVAAFERLITPEWVVVVELPVAEAYKSLTDQIALAAVVFVLCIMLAVLFGLYFSKSVTRPLIHLRDGAKKVGAGDLTTEIPVETYDEIGELAAGFNRMVSDLREKEKIHKKYVQSEKLAAIGQMAGGVAHEINNPLGIILGFAQALLSRMKEGDEPYMPLKSIERETLRCKGLVQNLLSFSRMGKDGVETIDVNNAIDEIVALISTQAKIKSVEVVMKLSPSLPNSALNRNQIQQVIMNLCNNAIDAMPAGGMLTVATKAMAGSIEINVSDTGMGINDEAKEHLFEAFYTTKPIGKGTGLGLSLCNEIVKGHNGAINVSSEPGLGTTFTVTLPIV